MKRPDVNTSMLFQVLAVGLGLVSALILARGAFAVSPDMMAELASTKFDYNPQALEALAGQAADTKVGTLFLVLSVLFQSLSLRPGLAKPSKTGSRNAVLIALGVSLTSWYIGGVCADADAGRLLRQAEAVWAARNEQAMSE